MYCTCAFDQNCPVHASTLPRAMGRTWPISAKVTSVEKLRKERDELLVALKEAIAMAKEPISLMEYNAAVHGWRALIARIEGTR